MLGQVLPALGMVAEVNALITDRMKRPSFEENTPAALMMFAAREYRAHGYVKESDELGNRAIAWYQSRPASEMNEDRLLNVTNALIHVGRLAEARAAVDQAIRKYPEMTSYPDIITAQGRIAARMGDAAAAKSYMDRLRNLALKDRPGVTSATEAVSSGRRTSVYGRALITAGLGDKAMAFTLLQQAFSEGNFFEPYLHREIELQSIQDYPPLKELLWPEG